MNYNFDWEIIEKCREAKKYQNSQKAKKSRKDYQHEYYLRVTKPKRSRKGYQGSS